MMGNPFLTLFAAIAAAEKLRRRWIGIHITWLTINLVKGSINSMFPDATFMVEGEPRDMGDARDLATKDRFDFQYWAFSLINAMPYRSTPSKPREGKSKRG